MRFGIPFALSEVTWVIWKEDNRRLAGFAQRWADLMEQRIAEASGRPQAQTVAWPALLQTARERGQLTIEERREVILILCQVWYGRRSLYSWAKQRGFLRSSD